MSGNRKQRRAVEATHKPRWYKLDGSVVQGGLAKALPEEMAQYVYGKLGDITIIRIPAEMPIEEKMSLLASFREAIALSGIESKVLVVPSSVSMVRLRPVDPATAAQLDKQLMAKQAVRVSAMEKLSEEAVASDPGA